MEKFCDRLKELREEAGVSMAQLSEALDVSNAAICKWENGLAEPKVSYLIKLSNFFECTVDYLVGITDEFDITDLTYNNFPQKLSYEEKQLIETYRELAPAIKALILETLNAWKDKI